MTLSKNLQKLMRQHANLSVTALAKATNIPQPTLYQLYMGTTQRPRKKTLEVLANYFAVLPEQLLGLQPLPDGVPQKVILQLQLQATPILNWDDLPGWPNQLNVEQHKKIILDSGMSSDATFAIEMNDASMEPLFPCGCLLIFDANKTPKDRDCIMIQMHQTAQFLFKKVLIDGDVMYLKSINTELNDIPLRPVLAEDRIIGTLLEARIKF